MGKIRYETNSRIRGKIGQNIVRLREAQNISQAELVAKLNLIGCTADRFAVSSIENNHSCDLNLLADIKTVLSCEWKELLEE